MLRLFTEYCDELTCNSDSLLILWPVTSPSPPDMDTLALTFHLEMNVVPMKMLAPDMFASMDEFIEHATEYR